MKARLILHDKQTDELGNTVEMKMWQVPVSEHTPHGFKYSLMYIVESVRVITTITNAAKVTTAKSRGASIPSVG